MTEFARPRREMVGRVSAACPVPPSPDVIAAMTEIPRHLFVEKPLRHLAYGDSSLPIGRGQTLSQPATVLACLSMLAPGSADVMLEIGSGSGYLAAVASRLCARVYGIETMLDLVHSSRKLLSSLGISNVRITYGDGGAGLPAHAPFDCILFSAACPAVRPEVFGQLSEGGRLGAPVGTASGQEFRFWRKSGGRVEETGASFPCTFVPLTGRFGTGG